MSWFAEIKQAISKNKLDIQYFHQVTATKTTLTTATNADGSTYIVDVANTAIFTVGNYLQFGATNHQMMKPMVLAKTATTLTLDSYIDTAFAIGTEVILINIDLNTTGTLASPNKFIVKPDDGKILNVHRLVITMTHTNSGDLGKFGDISGGLTNGFLIRANIDGQYFTITNWKTSEDIKGDVYDVDFNTRATGGGGGGGTINGTTARGSFDKLGGVVSLNSLTGDFLECYARDDISSLLTFKIKAEGNWE